MVEDNNKVVTVNDSDNQQAEAVSGVLGVVVDVVDNTQQVEGDAPDEGDQAEVEAASDHDGGDVQQGPAGNVFDPSSS